METIKNFKYNAVGDGRDYFSDMFGFTACMYLPFNTLETVNV